MPANTVSPDVRVHIAADVPVIDLARALALAGLRLSSTGTGELAIRRAEYVPAPGIRRTPFYALEDVQ